MLKYLNDLSVQFQLIRTMALQLKQPMIAYLAEMGIEECAEQTDKLRKMPR